MIVDLMASDVWSSLDIANKVQALIRSKVSETDELKAARLARKNPMTEADQAFVTYCDTSIAEALAQGKQAVTDMALLAQVLELERATARLALPVIEPELDEDGLVWNQEVIDADTATRAEYQAVIDAGSAEAKALFDLRNPYVEPEPVIEIETEGEAL
jgi:hypothetical protein